MAKTQHYLRAPASPRPVKRSLAAPDRLVNVGLLHSPSLLAEGIRSLLLGTGQYQVFSVTEATSVETLQLQLLVSEVSLEAVHWAAQRSLPTAFVIHHKPDLEVVVQLLSLPLVAVVEASEAKELLIACTHLLEGKSHVSPDTAINLLRDIVGPTRPVLLNPRELEVLLALRGQQDLATVAGTLQISPNTLKKHLNRLYQKLGVRDRHQAVEKARLLELFD